MGLWTCAIGRSGGLRYRWGTRLHRDSGVRGQRSAGTEECGVALVPPPARAPQHRAQRASPAPRTGEGSLVAGTPDAPQLALLRTRLLETDCGSEFLRPNSEAAGHSELNE